MEATGEAMTEINSKLHDWVVQLCEYHAVKYRASYWVHSTIKEALLQKKGCIACKLDMPNNIKKVNIEFDWEE